MTEVTIVGGEKTRFRLWFMDFLNSSVYSISKFFLTPLLFFYYKGNMFYVNVFCARLAHKAGKACGFRRGHYKTAQDAINDIYAKDKVVKRV